MTSAPVQSQFTPSVAQYRVPQITCQSEDGKWRLFGNQKKDINNVYLDKIYKYTKTYVKYYNTHAKCHACLKIAVFVCLACPLKYLKSVLTYLWLIRSSKKRTSYVRPRSSRLELFIGLRKRSIIRSTLEQLCD